MFVTSIAVAGFVYIAVGGSVGQVAKITNVIPLILAVTTDYVINIGLLVGVIALQTQSAPLNIWKENFLWTAPIATIGAAIGSATLGLGYQFYHFYGVMLFLIPGLLIRYSYKLNVGRKNRVV
jgi:hypothetical protein